MKTIFDSRQLQVYVILARTANLSHAAEELQMTPSGVSHCLKSLEADLGCRLFDRNSRKFVLSQAGREFLAGAEQILEQMKSLRGKISTWINWRHGQLFIGANSTACQFLLPPILREFRESFPGFNIKIEQCSSRQAVALIMEERLDLALLTEGAEKSPAVKFNPVGEDDLQFILNPLHRWAIKRKAQPKDISNGKLILPERSGNTYTIIESYFHAANINIEPFIEIANEQAIKEFVRLDMGVGILPKWLVADEIKEGSLVALPLGRQRLKRRWGVLHSNGRALSLADNLFINLSRSVFRSLVQSSEL